MEILHIDLGSHSYTIHIDSGLLTNLPSYLGSAEAWVVITDEVVDGLYGQELVENWNHNRVHKIVLPAGEETKNLQTVEEILRKMLNFGVTRRSRVLALGGGVVGD
ncbi:MAG TPA: 3-dehydroquinate synthase, partial [Firmicutes bacterium]|nr:3-dehydroquinate synthase [Bacillota bacterium]